MKEFWQIGYKMKVFREFPFHIEKKPRGIALGFFDGVHLGHQRLINKMIKISREKNLTATVFTFDGHPHSKFNAEFKFAGFIQDSEHRLENFKKLACDEVILAPMIPQVKEISAYDFFHHYMVGEFGMEALIVGKDAKFGHKGQGNVDLLKQWSHETNIDLTIVGDVLVDGYKLSSTLIRNLIEQGKISEANKYLGYNYVIQGEVVHGKKLGRTLGFPTINIHFNKELVKPLFGVYASSVNHNYLSYPAITSIGTNPTVSDDKKIKVETYIYDKNIDLYHEKVSVELLDFIRPEIAFDSVETMKKRIQFDLEEVNKWHNQEKIKK